MIKEYKFNKERILLGIVFLLLMLIFSFYFLLEPEKFIRNIFTRKETNQILGIMGIILFSSLIFSSLKILPRKYAIRITDEYLIDNSKYESFGKIEWNNISKTQRIKKYSIEIFLNEPVFKDRKIDMFRKYLLFMSNWNYKKSIIISSAILNCDVEELYKEINLAHKKNKKTIQNSHL
ncbi:STM3941 family protein [Flavobacterium ponti]|uniref:STM3941 family protein n=1 Tax=Flavobacterium ponti TaxID=665133 RepID=A0ABV9P3V8_9FLAO